MIELRGDPRLVDEHLDERLIAGEVRQDLLDRDELLEPELTDQLRLEQLGHATDREPIEDLVPPDLLGGRVVHRALIIQRCQFGSFTVVKLAAMTPDRPPASRV